jgi:DNA-binding MarR family transcriptional regulator
MATTSRYMKSKYGVTGRQRLIIQVVNEFPGISAGDLARVLHLDPSTLTGVLQQMSERGLLQLQSDTRDRRRLRIQLTPKGRRLSHMTVGAIEAAVSRTLLDVSPAKLRATREVLELLAGNLDRKEPEPLAGQATSA